ncbi:MAG: hypothetical protein ACREH3_15785 [Geminicoccales bacterium]
MRTTEAIERRFREVRRRTRPMGTFQDRTSMERILFAVFMHENRNQRLATPFALTQTFLTLPPALASPATARMTRTPPLQAAHCATADPVGDKGFAKVGDQTRRALEQALLMRGAHMDVSPDGSPIRSGASWAAGILLSVRCRFGADVAETLVRQGARARLPPVQRRAVSSCGSWSAAR